MHSIRRRRVCHKAAGTAGVAAQTLSDQATLAGMGLGTLSESRWGASWQADAAGPGRTGIFLLWPGQTQAPAAVYPPCQTLALRDEGEGTGGVDQADHMSFSEGGGVKEFKATCPVIRAYSRHQLFPTFRHRRGGRRLPG